MVILVSPVGNSIQMKKSVALLFLPMGLLVVWLILCLTNPWAGYVMSLCCFIGLAGFVFFLRTLSYRSKNWFQLWNRVVPKLGTNQQFMYMKSRFMEQSYISYRHLTLAKNQIVGP